MTNLEDFQIKTDESKDLNGNSFKVVPLLTVPEPQTVPNKLSKEAITDAAKEAQMAKKEAKKALKTNFWANSLQKAKLHSSVRVPVNNPNNEFECVATTRPKMKQNEFACCYGDWVQTIGFELKLTLSDLQQDVKFIHYMGFVDFMYYIVPYELVKDAMIKLSPFPQIGIIDITTCEIVKEAFITLVKDEKRLQLFEQLQFQSI